MTFKGTIQNGKVVLDEPIALPNGTTVRVEAVRTSRAKRSVYRLYELAVADDTLPADYAAEVDHYLYGTPRRSRRPSPKAAKPSTKSGRSRATKPSKRRSR